MKLTNFVLGVAALLAANLGSFGCLAAETSTSAGFRLFLENELKNFQAWLQTAENADPTPQTPIESFLGEWISTNLFSLDYTLGYEQMLGFVKQNTKRTIEHVHVEMIDMHFSVGVTSVGKTVFRGNYTAKGNVKLESDIPVTGYGEWNVTSTSIQNTYNATFSIDDQGFVKLPEVSSYSGPTFTTLLELDDEQTYFEELSENAAGGFAPEIQKQMGIELKDRYAKWYREHPIGNLLHSFLLEAFKKAPLAEIIKTTE